MLLDSACLLLFPVVVMLSWLKLNTIYTKRLRELCAKEYSDVYMNILCLYEYVYI